jgi:predicted GNAT family acetyltransferase
MMIRDVTDSHLERVRLFLESHLDTSLFLLSNLAVFGPRAVEHSNSGDFRCLEENGRIAAVFCVTRAGNLLVQAGGRAELAPHILRACARDSARVTGAVGEWPTSAELWRLLCADPQLQPGHATKDVLYTRQLTQADTTELARRDRAPTRRLLEAQDFALWEPLNTAYLAELGLPPERSMQRRKEEFESRASARRWWGAFEGDSLEAIAGLNAVYGRTGQVGGVYSRPQVRGMGYAGAVMRQLMVDCRLHHHFERLVLFTAEDNSAARRLYEALGFEASGAFGLFLGTRPQGPRSQGV